MIKADKAANRKVRRNYQFMQFLVDLFGGFILYLIVTRVIGEIVYTVPNYNAQFRAQGGEVLKVSAYPLIVWVVVAALIFVAGIVLPLVFAKRTTLTQKQYDMWVYGVLCVRTIAMMAMSNFIVIHLSVIMRDPQYFDLYILIHAVLIAIIVRFTQIRIRAAEPKKEGKIRIITED